MITSSTLRWRHLQTRGSYKKFDGLLVRSSFGLFFFSQEKSSKYLFTDTQIWHQLPFANEEMKPVLHHATTLHDDKIYVYGGVDVEEGDGGDGGEGQRHAVQQSLDTSIHLGKIQGTRNWMPRRREQLFLFFFFCDRNLRIT